MQIEGKVCLVTGAAIRVGRAIALELASRGARVVVHYATSRQEALATAEECAGLSGHTARAFQADQSLLLDVERMVGEVEEEYGRIDVLVNSAAVFYSTPFLQMTSEQWDEMFNVNTRGPAWFCRAVAPGMIERGEGVIINVVDTNCENPAAGFVSYGASKAALLALTRGLARELAPSVRVNAVGPGSVLLPTGASDDLVRRCAESCALGCIGSPEDVAAACVFLVEGSDFMTGTFLTVDGGKLPPHVL